MEGSGGTLEGEEFSLPGFCVLCWLDSHRTCYFSIAWHCVLSSVLSSSQQCPAAISLSGTQSSETWHLSWHSQRADCFASFTNRHLSNFTGLKFTSKSKFVHLQMYFFIEERRIPKFLEDYWTWDIISH